MAHVIFTEELPIEVAGPEVRTLRVWDLHLWPLPFTLEFENAQERRWEWTTSPDYKEQNPGAASPKQYTQGVTDKGETVAQYEQRTGWRLVAVKMVTRKGGEDVGA